MPVRERTLAPAPGVDLPARNEYVYERNREQRADNFNYKLIHALILGLREPLRQPPNG